MRKVLYRYTVKHSGPGRLLFGTRNNTQVTVRNFERDFALIGANLAITGVRFSPHTLRHTFAVSYLRAGGNMFYLSKILGHTRVNTTQKYLQSVVWMISRLCMTGCHHWHREEHVKRCAGILPD
jgi:site-specific recombinase XerD